jgi:cytochrome P450
MTGDDGFDPYSATVASAFSTYEESRATCPVMHSPARGGFYALLNHEDVKAALRDHRTYISGKGVSLRDTVAGHNVPLEYDPPVHTAQRAMFTDVLTPTAVKDAVPSIRSTVDALIDAFIEDGNADLHSAFAAPLAAITVAGFIGLSADDARKMMSVSAALLDPKPDQRDAIGAFVEFCNSVVEDRQRSPRGDWLSLLASLEANGELPGDAPLVGWLTGFFIAGHDTTRAAMTSLLYHVASDPDLQAAIREDWSLAAHAVEENLRLNPPFHYFGRTVEADVEVDGVAIPAGSRVLMSFAAANRDPSQYEDPDEFRLERPRRQHLTFGLGIHLCPGSLLARTEMREGLVRILERLGELRAETTTNPLLNTKLRGGSMAWIDSLPVTFTAAPRSAHTELAWPR